MPLFDSRWTPVEKSFSSATSGSLTTQVSIFGLRSSPVTSSSPHKVLVLLHGYPQNHTLWYLVAQELEAQGVLDEWDVLIPDLPGYGQSTKTPSPDGSHIAHSKRAIAQDILIWVDTIFSEENVKLVIAGHDRGARVAHRLAKDHPQRVIGLCVQDIVPGQMFFDLMTEKHEELFKNFHWVFLALPSPLPETLIAGSYAFFFRYLINGATGVKFRGKFDEDAMESWVEQFHDTNVIEGTLEDYRAGATIDLLHDAEDSKDGKGKVTMPTLSLYGSWLGNKFDVESIWKMLGDKVTVRRVGDDDTGHFLPTEAAEQTGKELSDWLSVLP